VGRGLFSILAALSLVLCLATVVEWVRTLHNAEGAGFFWRRFEEIPASRRVETFTASVRSSAGGLSFLASRSGPGTISKRINPPRSGWSHSFSGTAQYPTHFDAAREGKSDSSRRIAGFEIWRRSWPGYGKEASGAYLARAMTVPHWFIALVFALFPARWFMHVRRERRRRLRAKGLCVACGYDLRASAERCPECGTPAGVEAPVVKPAKSHWLARIGWSVLLLAFLLMGGIWVKGCWQLTTELPPPPPRLDPSRKLEPVAIKYPKPAFESWHPYVPPGFDVERFSTRYPLMAPPGAVNLALHHPVSSSDKELIIGRREQITDGQNEDADENLVELSPGLQWVQIDLGQPCEIWGVLLWHQVNTHALYKCVIVQIADDAAFTREVRTIFSNDQANTAGLGRGTDKHYWETSQGKQIQCDGSVARYVGLYSAGNEFNEYNQYYEVEVFGVPAK
jgi:hypothetical protein